MAKKPSKYCRQTPQTADERLRMRLFFAKEMTYAEIDEKIKNPSNEEERTLYGHYLGIKVILDSCGNDVERAFHFLRGCSP